MLQLEKARAPQQRSQGLQRRPGTAGIKACAKEASCPAVGHPSLHGNPNPRTKEEMSREGASLMGAPLGLVPRIQAELSRATARLSVRVQGPAKGHCGTAHKGPRRELVGVKHSLASFATLPIC